MMPKKEHRVRPRETWGGQPGVTIRMGNQYWREHTGTLGTACGDMVWQAIIIRPKNKRIVREGKTFGIDQQGGKGGANFTEDVAPTVLSDSHGTPHAVCYAVKKRGET